MDRWKALLVAETDAHLWELEQKLKANAMLKLLSAPEANGQDRTVELLEASADYLELLPTLDEDELLSLFCKRRLN